jgi:hypothetical protein
MDGHRRRERGRLCGRCVHERYGDKRRRPTSPCELRSVPARHVTHTSLICTLSNPIK